MNKTIFLSILLCTISLVACAKSDEGQVKSLDKAAFLKKIVNYEQDSTQSTPAEWLYLGDRPAIIDFYATWCGPCKQLAPILEELAGVYKKEIYIYKIDVDKEPELATLFNIQSIPTLIYIPMKGDPQISRGLMPKENLEKIITDFLLKK